MGRHPDADGDVNPLDYRAQIEKVLGTDTRWTADDIILMIVQGKMQLFTDKNGIVVTQILVTRDRRLLVFLLSGENMSEWKESMTQRLIDFARKQNCICIEAWCRPGLEHALKELGWKKEQVVLRIKL